MNIDPVKSGFEEAGWKNLQPGSHFGIEFDLVGERRFLGKWNVLIKVLPLLDGTTVNMWKVNFESISNRSKSLILGRCFLLCLLAEDVSPQVSETLSADSFGLFGIFRLKGGGGNVLVGNVKNGGVYGEVPSLPYDLHKFSKSAKEIILQTVGPSRIPLHPLPSLPNSGPPSLPSSGPPSLPNSGPPPLPAKEDVHRS
ncbi:MAG: hypothetical protein GY872_02030 [Roseibacillus sp.]|nr:hypothetical protein [Roseibacillus sp.]